MYSCNNVLWDRHNVFSSTYVWRLLINQKGKPLSNEKAMTDFYKTWYVGYSDETWNVGSGGH